MSSAITTYRQFRGSGMVQRPKDGILRQYGQKPKVRDEGALAKAPAVSMAKEWGVK